MVAVSVAHHKVHRAHGCGELTAHKLPALAEDLGDLLREKLLQVSLDAVLHEAGVDTQVLGDIRDDLVDADDQLVVSLVGLNRPDLLDALLVLIGLTHGDRAGSRHPVERLIRATLRMDEDRAVTLEHDDALGRVQVGAQTTGIINGAGSNNNTHPVSLPILLRRGAEDRTPPRRPIRYMSGVPRRPRNDGHRTPVAPRRRNRRPSARSAQRLPYPDAGSNTPA